MRKLLTGLLALALFSACDLYEDPITTESRIQVEPKQFSEQVSTADADAHYLKALAESFASSGSENLQISVTYDPRSSSASSVKAAHELTRIKTGLAQNGITNVQGGILPVQGQGDDLQLLATYQDYVALPPEDCEMMDGMENRKVTLDESYRQGCTVESIFARQVAHPQDLAGGRDTPTTTEGRRAANLGEFYRAGVPNKPLKGESASGEGE